MGRCECQGLRRVHSTIRESAVKDAKDAVRTNLACLVRRFGQEFPGGHPVLSWLVEYSAAVVNRCRRGPDGKTACELRKGRTLCGVILFMVPGVTEGVARVEPRWEDGIFLGVSDRSDELYVGTERGMHKVRTARRREATERVDLTLLNFVSARPWDGLKNVRDVRIVLPDVSSPAAMAEAEAIGKGRRLYISKADIMNHGLTEGCRGCRCLAEGKRAQGHSERCRTRVEAEIAKPEDGRARLTTAYLRSLPRDEGREVRRHQQQFQRHRDRMGFRTSRWMPEKRRDNVVQKMLVMKQMTQVVEVHSSIQDRWLTTACPSSGGEAEALGEDAVALVETYSSTTRQRAGAFGLSAGVAVDLRLGWNLEQ